MTPSTVLEEPASEAPPSRAADPDRPRRSRSGWVVGGVVAAALLAGALIDLLGPRRADLRQFDPDQVARLDTRMWRSYYQREPLPLFLQLADLMRRQFHFPRLRSYVAAYHAARAAFVFKDGRDRSDYERALPDLVRYYGMIRRVSTTPFDVERVARLELEWWIVHRQRDRHTEADLARALAAAAAALYRAPLSSMAEYARWRTEAMVIRDTRAAQGGVTDADWRRIERHLQTSWRALWRGVQPVIAAGAPKGDAFARPPAP